MAVKKVTEEPKPAEEKDNSRVIPLRTFVVTFEDPNQRPSETVMAHNMAFPHPREVIFVDILIDGNIVSQFNRRAYYGWQSVVEVTASGSAAERVM